MRYHQSFYAFLTASLLALYSTTTFQLVYHAQETPPEPSDSGVSAPEHQGGAGWGNSDHSSRERHDDSSRDEGFEQVQPEPITPKPIEDIDEEDKRDERSPLGIQMESSSSKGDITPLDFSSQKDEGGKVKSGNTHQANNFQLSKEDLEDKTKYLIGQIKQPGATVFIPTIMFLFALLAFAILKQKPPKPPNDNDW